MTPIIHSAEQFDVVCHEKSIFLLKESLVKKELPSKAAHVWIAIKTIAHESFSVMGKILSIAGNIFMLIMLPVSKGEKQKKEMLAYRLCCLILDPVNVMTGIIASTMRISSSVLGIGSPSLAVKGWIYSEKIEQWTVGLKANLWKKIAPNSPYSLKLHKISPTHALRYLGEKCCVELERAAKSKEELEKLNQDLKNAFFEYLTHLHTNAPAKLAKAFEVNSNTPSKISLILQKLSSEENTPDINKVKEVLEDEEINDLYEHVNLAVFTNNAEKMYDQFRNILRCANKEIITDSDYAKRKDEIEQLLDHLKFGNVKFSSI